MANMFGTIGERFANVFVNMSSSQKLTMIIVVVVGLAGIIGVVHWASSPDYVPLFSNLPPEDAGKIVDWLTENNIPYRLEQNGERILVPRGNQYNARIQLAEEGLPSQRSTGYEIFDKTNLGMSEFVQKLNFRRALEGELSRTIETIDQVSEARVHIVIPEPALFREKEKQPTASVALKLSSKLNDNQVSGIAHLIASSVEGLETSNITIIDTRGNVLSNLTNSDPLMAMTTTQIQLKQNLEQNLTDKVSTMLDRLLGTDKSIVRVSVDMDFTKSDVTSEIYDPDQTAVRSEEIVENTHQQQDQNQVNPVDPSQPPLGQSDVANESNTITNYEVSKTVTSTSTQGGTVKRISASVVVDGVYEPATQTGGGAGELQYRDRTTQELGAIQNVVQGALGYDETRGDQLSVITMAFQEPADVMPKPSFWDWLRNTGPIVLRNLLLGGAVIGLLFYLRNLLQRTGQAARESWERRLAALPSGRGALPGAIGGLEERLALPDIDSELPPEVVEANQLQEQIIDFATEKPEVAARLLKSWLVETPS
ncbi:MAG: flagellar basal-body MS-ring/collar protein FliF [bacterium]